MQEVTSVETFFPAATGEDFLCFGLKFTSYELIQGDLVLMVDWGTQTVVNLVGLGTAVIPTPDPDQKVKTSALAEVQLALEGVYNPGAGYFELQAQLTSASFVLSKSCRLTGGFAVAFWYKGDYAGDFVLTVGGYAKKFNVPSYYPTVPRVGFNWKVSHHLTIKGGAYFALCPHVLMAGGSLEATWHSESLDASFSAWMDVLLGWKPYHYETGFGISISGTYHFSIFGCHESISASVSAQLNVWGPDFSGNASVDMIVASVSVHFGHSSSQALPIDWPTFQSSFLPSKSDVVTVTVQKGLIPQSSKQGQSSAKNLAGAGQKIRGSNGQQRAKKPAAAKPKKSVQDLGVVNPSAFALAINSVVPAQGGTVGEKAETLPAENVAAFGIAPMDLTASDVTSAFKVTVKKDGADQEGYFAFEPIYKNLPAALWGQQMNSSLNAKSLIDHALMGWTVTPKPFEASSNLPFIPCSKLQTDVLPISNAFAWDKASGPQVTRETAAQRRQSLSDSLQQTSDPSLTTQQEMLTALGFSNDDVDISADLADVFLAAPQIETAT